MKRSLLRSQIYGAMNLRQRNILLTTMVGDAREQGMHIGVVRLRAQSRRGLRLGVVDFASSKEHIS